LEISLTTQGALNFRLDDLISKSDLDVSHYFNFIQVPISSINEGLQFDIAPSHNDLDSVSTDTNDECRDAVVKLFRLVLRRDPDDEALSAFSTALESKVLTPLSMVRELLYSKEFGERALLHRSVADYVIRTLYATLVHNDTNEEIFRAEISFVASGKKSLGEFIAELLERDEYALVAASQRAVVKQFVSPIIEAVNCRQPDEITLNSYVGAIKSTYMVKEFIEELLSSDDFRSRYMKKLGISIELAQLCESLIANGLASKGCKVYAPPSKTVYYPTISERQMANLIYTLSILGEI